MSLSWRIAPAGRASARSRLADGVVGSVLLGIPAHLLDSPSGLVAPLALPLPVLVVAACSPSIWPSTRSIG